MRGSVVRRGNRIYAVVYLGFEAATGKRRYKWISGFKNEREAEGFLVHIATNPGYGSGVGPRGSTRLRLGDFLDRWLRTATKARCGEVELRARECLIRRHIKPRLGHIPLAKLAPATVEEFFATLQRVDPQRIFKILRAALNHAVRLQLILANPCDPIETPKAREYRPVLWTPEEALQFLAEARRSSHYYPLYLLLITTGIRPGGEVVAILRRDVDLDHGVLHMSQGLERPRGGGFSFTTLKTPHSRRPIRLPEEVVRGIRVLFRQQAEERLRRGLCTDQERCRNPRCPRWHDYDLLFTKGNGRPLHWHNVVQRDFTAVIKRAKVPRIRPYDIRHWHITRLEAEGVPIKAIQERAGHSRAAFTMDRYAAHLPDQQVEAARVMGRLLSNQSLINLMASERNPRGGG